MPSSLSGNGPITFAIGGVDTPSYLQTLVSEWNAAHPHRWVTVILLPNDADGQDGQLVANLQAHNSLYDVMDLDVVWTAYFAANRWIVPLNSTLFPLHHFLHPAVATGYYANQLFAVPFNSNAGLLYYRRDILAAAHKSPPTTWAQLANLASTLAPKYHLTYGYAGQLESYEGLTVNFDEAVQSAGGSILSRSKVTLASSPAASEALQFLLTGLRAGWIPKEALSWDETDSANAFLGGRLLFLRNWPYVYGEAQTPGPSNLVAGKVGVTALPGLHGPGPAVLGGANLAISAYSRHQISAEKFIQFMTSKSSQKELLQNGSQPPVWASLYTDPALVKKFPYLSTLKNAILTAQSRPETPRYIQLSLVISRIIHQALVQGPAAGQTIAELANQTIAELAKQLRPFVPAGG